MQLIRYGGALITIKSAAELNNAQQLWLPYGEYCLFDDVMNSADSVSEEQLCGLF